MGAEPVLMLRKALLLVGLALLPDSVVCAVPGILASGHFGELCIFSVVSWCVVFGIIFANSPREHRVRLLFLLPLLLLALGFPTLYAYLVLKFVWAMDHGIPPP